jgi:tetratricopeptide (TPR) repeat protein
VKTSLVILLLAIASNAAAQTEAPPPPTTPATPPSTTDPTLPGSDDDPRALFDRGSALYALGRYAEAAPLFERAFELKADPALLFNAAQAYRFMGNKPRALTLYQNYIRLYGDTIPNADDVRHQIDQLKEAIAADERSKSAPPTGVQTPQTPGGPTLIASAPPPRKPLVKRPWFWVAVGGGAAVVITAVAVGVAVGTRGHTDPNASFGTVSGN